MENIHCNRASKYFRPFLLWTQKD